MKKLGKLLIILALCSCEHENIEILNENINTGIPESQQNSKFSSILNNNGHSRTELEIGGSNYPVYDVQGYLNGGDWFKDDNLQTVVAEYHENPNIVKNQLQTMYNNGQRKIAIVIWFCNQPHALHGHVINSINGKLTEQQEENLTNLLNDIQAIGYNEVVIRFGINGTNAPGEWTSWNNQLFQEYWNFTYNTIKLANNTLLNSPIKRIYDLALEMGGHNKGQENHYIKSIWQNYHSIQDPSNNYYLNLENTSSYCSSIIADEGKRLNELIRVLKDSGSPLPNEYAFDIYGQNNNSTFQNIKNVLELNGEGDKNIIIQETYYNDTENFTDLIKHTSNNNINLRTIYQWQFTNDSPKKHFTVNYPNEYKLPPYIANSGHGTDNLSLWINGQFYTSNSTTIQLRKSTGNREIISTYQSDEFDINDNHTSISLRLKSPEEITLFNNEGLRVFVVNQDLSTWSTYGNHHVTTGITYGITNPNPVIENSGVGCSDYKCLWITGQFRTENALRIELRKAEGDRGIVGIYNPGEFTNNGTTMTLRFKTQYEADLLFSQGLRIYVVDGTFGTFSTYGNNNITKI